MKKIGLTQVFASMILAMGCDTEEGGPYVVTGENSQNEGGGEIGGERDSVDERADEVTGGAERVDENESVAVDQSELDSLNAASRFKNIDVAKNDLLRDDIVPLFDETDDYFTVTGPLPQYWLNDSDSGHFDWAIENTHGSLSFWNNGTYSWKNRMTIGTYYMGVNAPTPQHVLHVNGTGITNIGLTNSYTGTASTDGTIIGIGTDKWLNINNREAAGIRFYVAGESAPRVSIDGNGLTVMGRVATGEILVNSVWADYVFDDDYALMPIESVEKYIRENRHLPDIPTAKEVAANGVSLGDSHAALLRKVEELTLYIIDQNKTIKEMKEQIEAMSRTRSIH